MQDISGRPSEALTPSHSQALSRFSPPIVTSRGGGEVMVPCVGSMVYRTTHWGTRRSGAAESKGEGKDEVVTVVLCGAMLVSKASAAVDRSSTGTAIVPLVVAIWTGVWRSKVQDRPTPKLPTRANACQRLPTTPTLPSRRPRLSCLSFGSSESPVSARNEKAQHLGRTSRRLSARS